MEMKMQINEMKVSKREYKKISKAVILNVHVN